MSHFRFSLPTVSTKATKDKLKVKLTSQNRKQRTYILNKITTILTTLKSNVSYDGGY